MVGTLFENSRIPLWKWFAEIYLCRADKDRISAERLRKLIDVQRRTVPLMMKKIGRATAKLKHLLLGIYTEVYLVTSLEVL